MNSAIRHALVKEAFIGNLLKSLWASKPVQWLRLATYGGGPLAQQFLGRFKSPYAYGIAKDMLMFGTLGGTFNVLLGDSDQSIGERYLRGFIPGLFGGAGWGLGTLAVHSGAAKLLPKTFTPEMQARGLKQRIGIWGQAGIERLKQEHNIAQTARTMAQQGQPASAIAARVKQMEEATLPYQEYGKWKNIMEATKGRWGERAKRLLPYFVGGATALGTGFVGSELATSLVAPAERATPRSYLQERGYFATPYYGAYYY